MSEHEQDNPTPDDHDTVAKKATVTVKKAVDGTPRKKKRSRGSRTNRKRAIPNGLSLSDVDDRVKAAAEQARKPGQVLRPVSTTEVMVVNK